MVDLSGIAGLHTLTDPLKVGDVLLLVHAALGVQVAEDQLLALNGQHAAVQTAVAAVLVKHFNEVMDGIDLDLSLDEHRKSVEIRATVRCDGRTGVEMEALTAVSTAALTVYDMCKAVQKDMVITDIRLVQKTGGVHGDYLREE